MFPDAEVLRDIARQISSSSSDESPVSPRDSISHEELPAFNQFFTKKIYEAAKLLGGKTVERNFMEVSMKLGEAKQVTGGTKWTYSKTARKELANLINALYIKRRFLNYWAIFTRVERNIWVEAGEPRAKTITKTYTRRHVGDKA